MVETATFAKIRWCVGTTRQKWRVDARDHRTRFTVFGIWEAREGGVKGGETVGTVTTKTK